MKSYTAIRLYGPGHVVAYNYVADFHDGIDTEMYGMPDGSNANEGPTYPPREYWDRRPVAIDIYNNYITNAHDNSIEMDGSMHNIRVMRNVLINSASHPMSTQPSVGGPIYWIRNIVYHAPGGSTRSTAGSPGVIFYHNTVTSETTVPSGANTHWLNNLMLGQSTAPAIFSVTTSTRVQLVGLQRLPSESRRGVFVPVERAGGRRGRGRPRQSWRRWPRRARAGPAQVGRPLRVVAQQASSPISSRRSPTTRRPRVRIATACSWTTTYSSRCRSSIAIRRPCSVSTTSRISTSA